MIAARPAMVVFSPLPPMPTGIGDYCAELLPELQAYFQITVVVEDGRPDLVAPAGTILLSLAEYEAAADLYRMQPHLYQIGNNPDHTYMLPTLARRPGVVVLHDLGLHHLLDCATAALGDADGYCQALITEYGAPGAVLARHWCHDKLRDRVMYADMPMLRQIAGAARHVIVHSRYACQKALSQAPATPITIAPHQYRPPAATVSRADMRTRLGLGPDELVFLSLGFVTHIKRIDTALRALARLRGRLPPYRYVIAGEQGAGEPDVMALAQSLGLEAQVLTTGYVAEADFFGVIAAADVVINLRYPVGGETSGTLIRALGSGACTVVIDRGPFAEIPDGAAIKLPWGDRIETDLADALLRLAIHPQARAQIGAAAAAFVAERHGMARTVAAYRSALAAAAMARPWSCETIFEYLPPQVLARWRGRVTEAPLWFAAGAVPSVQRPGPALALGADLALLRALGHEPKMVGMAWRPATEPPRALDLIVLQVGTGWDGLGCERMLEQLNAALSFGGLLVLQVEDGAAAQFSGRGAGERRLVEAGFRVDLATATAAPMLVPPAPSPAALVWRAVKISEFYARSVAA